MCQWFQLETSNAVVVSGGKGSLWPHTIALAQNTARCVPKPTVAAGVDAFEQAALGLEADDAVPLAVQHLQPGENRGIQVHQPVVPHIQLGHVPQEVRLIWHHAGDLIQPDRGRGEEAKGQLLLAQVELHMLWSFLWSREGTRLGWWLIYCAVLWVQFSTRLICVQHGWQ